MLYLWITAIHARGFSWTSFLYRWSRKLCNWVVHGTSGNILRFWVEASSLRLRKALQDPIVALTVSPKTVACVQADPPDVALGLCRR